MSAALIVVAWLVLVGWAEPGWAEEVVQGDPSSGTGQWADTAQVELERAEPRRSPLSGFEVADLATVGSAGQGPRAWCLGDDTDTDPPGDPGPDLVWYSMTGACRGPGHDMTFEFRTLYAVPRFQLVLDTDRDKSTGCEGFDAFYLGDAGELYEVSTPACDQDSWISYSAGRYTTHDPDGTHVSFVVPGDVGRESHWYFIVANEDGSILDYSRIGYVTANEFIECSSVPSSATGSSSGYWLAGLDGGLWAFGSAPDIGHSCRSGNGVDVLVDLEAYPAVGDRPPTWVALHADGSITTGAVNQSVATPPAPWEVGAWRAVALIPHTGPAAADELGFWVVYDNGAVVPIGDNVPEVGDLRRMVLNQPIIDAVGDPDGTGYWLVGLDGGVFTFSGSFHGSMGGIPLNEPVVAMVADPDGTGYWLVASDGGVFAFDAPFVGSIPGVLQPGQRLNQPIVGMIPYGNGYLMLASDGGVFSFSDKPFVGSLGANPPAIPIVGVAASPAVV